MLFDKVKREHIVQGIKDFENKGMPLGFRNSRDYDLIYENKPYPPKAIMAYANFHASGRKIERYFKGGDKTECFKVLRKYEFKVNLKADNDPMINVKQEFSEWLLKHGPETYKHYYGNSLAEIENKLDEINNFFDKDLFKVDKESYKKLKLYLTENIYGENRRKNTAFFEYNELKGNGRPQAILGKSNYFKFLDEKFKSMNKKNEIFTWVQTHKELTNYLLSNEHNQVELVKILDSIGIERLNDQNPEGKTIKLSEIEPFTFYCYIYKYGDVRRLQNIQNIAKALNLTVPTDERGIPSAYAQKVWLFPYKYNRKNNEIQRLWQFFKDALNKSITNEQFADVLSITNVGKTKITEGLFYIMPEDFFPVNGPSKPYLRNVLKINPDFNTFSEYKNILQQIRSKTDMPFYELSYEAWKWNDQKNKNSNKAVNEIHENYSSLKPQTMDNNLNKILFGPPGTGKTYNTINEALKIVDSDFYNENKDSRGALNKRFKELLIKKWDDTKGQIAFCTFHQSFSYEDFVEGIKPKVNDKNEVFYKIENGVFKNICELADSNLSTLKVKKEGKLSWDESEFKRASFYKLSLGNSQISEDLEIYEYCRDHNCIALGFGQGLDYTGLGETEIKDKFEESGQSETDAQQFNYFKNYLKKGNYVLISNGNKYVRALGKVTGDYEYDPNAPIRYNHFRNVEWVFTDENIPIEEIYEVGLSQRTIYKINENKLKPEFFINQGQFDEHNETIEKDYVLIIDEINRGNVSSIFGELITLIETNKRAGRDEELEVILPYSKQPFKVPHNVHIIGTMNTADKSIEALDTALRRRFSFTEMPPKPKLIETESHSGKVNGVVDGVNLKQLLNTINKRIEKLIDKDHKIGHSYFLKVNDKPSLIHCFKNEVIPLLEEYFYGDYGKIGLVLGDSFIAKDETEDFEFAAFEGYDADVSEDLKQRSVYKIAKSKNWDFNTI